uniref:5-demethoxyubiquinone hydroxylase, mitochondrial n=1 Tax=Acrobeloides nanus TaxID=290746 RepID=A0A914C018_9BILA
MQRNFARFVHSAARKQLLEKIIRVDHIGELAANYIYAGQMVVMKGTAQSQIIENMWKEEKDHLDIMEKLVAKHEVPPTIFAPIFGAAAYALGVGTALLGKEGAMACTIAVEELIGQHYNDQIKELINDDPVEHKELLQTLAKMRDEELHHHDLGIQNDGLKAPFYQSLKWVIQSGCKGAIWISEKV